MRGLATHLVAEGIPHPDTVVALRRRWADEPDRTTRCDLVLAFGAVYTWQPDDALHDGLNALLTSADPQLALAACHALARTDPAVPARQVAVLVRAIQDPDAAVWQRSGWFDGPVGTLVQTTGALLTAYPDAATTFLTGIADRGAGPRAAVLSEAMRVLSEWRTVPGPLLSLLAEALDDPAADCRYLAAFLLGCLGTDSRPHADRLAALTDDQADGGLHDQTAVGDAAVWALARLDDPRCVPGLIARLSGSRLGLPSASIRTGRDMPWPRLPSMSEALIPLCDHADALIGALTSRLATADPTLTISLCSVLAEWGPAAAAAVPALAALRPTRTIVPAVATAAGAIGPAAASVASALRAHVAEPTVAWALWRTGADPELGADALIRHVTQHRGPNAAIRLLADLGPRAAACVDLLGELIRSDNEWTRARTAHALWRITGDPAQPVAVLTELTQPLARGDCRPVRLAALDDLAEIGLRTPEVTAVAESVMTAPHRLAYFGGWCTFDEDDRARAAAADLLGRDEPVPRA